MSEAEWIDRGEYPFQSCYLPLEAARMHYVDEGDGAPIVMVHGTPDWSFGYRKLVKGLAPEFRCVVPDMLGFWKRRERIREIPTLILWGMRDIAFREKELTRLETIFAHGRTVRFEDAGHFPQEEKPEVLCAEIRAHLGDCTRAESERPAAQ